MVYLEDDVEKELHGELTVNNRDSGDHVGLLKNVIFGFVHAGPLGCCCGPGISPLNSCLLSARTRFNPSMKSICTSSQCSHLGSSTLAPLLLSGCSCVQIFLGSAMVVA